MRHLFFFLMICPLIGQANSLTLDEQSVVSLAIERNEQVGIANAELARAQTTVDAAYSGLFPTMSAKFNLQKGKATGSVQPNGDDWNENANISLTQPLYTFGRLGSGIDIAKASLALGQNQRIATEAEVKQVARKLYYSVLYGQSLVKISQDSFNNAKRNKETLEKRVSYGRISRSDNLKMQADLASRQPLLIDAQKSLDVAKLELANFLALPKGTTFEVTGTLEKIPNTKQVVLDDSKVNSLADIRILSENLEIGKHSVDLARADRLPTLSAFGSFAPSTYREEVFGERTRQQESLTVGVSLSFDWPFGGGKNDEVQIKKVEQRIAELRLQAGKRQSITLFNSLVTRYESLIEKVKSELEAVSLAESSYRVALSTFSTGSVSQLQLNDSELLLTQNKMNLAATRLELHSTVAELERLLTEGDTEDQL